MGADHVGSRQTQQIRVSLRGKNAVLMGKNATMMSKAIGGHLANHPSSEETVASYLWECGL